MPGNPWVRLPPQAADLMEAELGPITAEILETIGREVPAYTRPLSGTFGEILQGGVNQALGQFVAMVRDPDTSQREEGRRVYFALGRGELEAGRSIGALLAAYRLGAQVAWRRLAEAGMEKGMDQRDLNLLAESIFAYIDELSAESAEGYAQAQADRAGQLDARRAELIDLLVRGTLGQDARALAAAAEEARWQVPGETAVLVWPAEIGRTPAARLPQNSIFTLRDEMFIALVPEPRDPARLGQLRRGFQSIRSGLGSASAPSALPRSFEHARAAMGLGAEHDAEGIVLAEEHRTELICRSDALLAIEIRQQRLAAFAGETANARERLLETLLAWLKYNGNVAQIAESLHVHSQTVRYRLTRLRELLGDSLDDPDARFELEYALRAPVSLVNRRRAQD